MLLTIAWRCGVGVVVLNPPSAWHLCPSTVLLDGIPHNFSVLTTFGVNQPLILQPRDSSTCC